MERRDFLHKLSHAAASPFVIPPFVNDIRFANPSSVLNNTAQRGNIVVLIKLNGGNDGLNTVVPLDQYQKLTEARPHVILPENKIIQLGDHDLGLHPELTGFKSLYDENRFKIIQNVGYASPDFSHFRSMDIWETGANSNQYLTSGWMGRYIESLHPEFPQAFPNSDYPHPLSIEIGNPSLLFTGQNSFTSYIASDPENFEEIINEFDNQYGNDQKGIKLDYIQLVSKQSNAYGEVVRNAYSNGSNYKSYSNSNLGQQFSIVSKLIGGGLNTRIYMVELGGFDTHDTQVDQSDHTKGDHALLMKDLNDSVLAFMQNMDAIGRSDDVLLMTYSEFGRTIVSNGSFGTDHGSAAPMFIFGNKIEPGTLGENPFIPENVSWQDNLEAEFDYRQIYSSVMSQWLITKSDTETSVLGRDFTELPIIQGRYQDNDGDGVSNINDLEPFTSPGAIVNLDGVAIFTLPSDNYVIQSQRPSCGGKTDGYIRVQAQDTSHEYTVYISQLDQTYTLNAANNHTIDLTELEGNTYLVQITIAGKTDYHQFFEIGVTDPEPLRAKSSVNYTRQRFTANLSGSDVYHLEVNGYKSIITTPSLDIALKTGLNRIKISTPKECQGIVEESIFISEQVKFFPNPVQENLHIVIPCNDEKIQLQLFSKEGALIFQRQEIIPFSRTIKVDMSNLSQGIYLVKLIGDSVNKGIKVKKQ